MTIPSGFFSREDGCPVSLAHGHALPAAHIPVSKASSANIGSTFSDIVKSYSHIVVKIFEKQLSGVFAFVGTGSLVSRHVVVTVAHLFKPGKNYIIQTIAHEILRINFPQVQISHSLDYALLPLKKPYRDINKPPLGFEENTHGAYGMMYYTTKELVISVGESGGYAHVEYNPLLALPGTEGSSGALVWNDKKQVVALHRGHHKDFSALRMPLFFHTIISDSRARYGVSLLDYDVTLSTRLRAVTPFTVSNLLAHPDITPERHGTLKVNKTGLPENLPQIAHEKITASEFTSTFEFLELLRGDRAKKIAFYASLKGAIGTVFRFKNGNPYTNGDRQEDGRIDIQSPSTSYQNIAIQIRDYTIATLLIKDSLLEHKENSLQREVANYCLHQLVGAVRHAQKTKQSIQLQIDPR